MTDTSTLTETRQIEDLLLTPERRAEIIRLRDTLAGQDDATASAITDLLDHADGVEWLVLGDDGPPLNKVRRYLRVIDGIATVYARRVTAATARGEKVKGHEAASLAALEWAGSVLNRVSSVDLSRPDADQE